MALIFDGAELAERSVFPAPSVSKQAQVVGLSWISMTTVASASEVADRHFCQLVLS